MTTKVKIIYFLPFLYYFSWGEGGMYHTANRVTHFLLSLIWLLLGKNHLKDYNLGPSQLCPVIRVLAIELKGHRLYPWPHLGRMWEATNVPLTLMFLSLPSTLYLDFFPNHGKKYPPVRLNKIILQPGC